MIVLINEGTRSGKEWLAYILKERNRAILIGSRTAGAFIGGKPFEIMPKKYLLFLAVDGNGPPGVDIAATMTIEKNKNILIAAAAFWLFRGSSNISSILRCSGF